MIRKANFFGLIIIFLCAGLVFMTSCEDEIPDPESPVATALELVSGGDQNATIETAIGNAVVVKVNDQNGDAFAGARVTFSVTEGSVSVSTATTDKDGKATVNWTLGATEGTQTLTVSALGKENSKALSGSPILVFATASPEPLIATSIILVSGGEQSATIETELEEAIVVQVIDQNDAPMSGVEVAFTPEEGSGSTSAGTVTSDAVGKATINWTLGATIGEQTLNVVSGEAQLQVTSIGKEIRVASSLSIVSGDNQASYVETDLANAIVVLVEDQDNAPISGVEVTFTPAVGSGAVSSETVTTDSEGQASVSWTLGATVGEQTLTVVVGEESLEVKATGREAKLATNIALESGGDQVSRVEFELANPVVVLVTDQNGDPFTGANIKFTVTEGSVGTGDDLSIDVLSNLQGKASSSWTLGATEGTQTLTVTAMALDGITPLSGAPISVTATATASNIDYGTMSDIDGNTYKTVTIGTQEWMAENLMVSKTSDGTAVDLVTDNTAWADLGDNDTDAAYCFYYNDAETYAPWYGALYTYAAAKNVCPAGWHLPSDDEWKTLEMFLGMSQADADLTGTRGTDQGTKLKSLSGWRNDGHGTDEYGFNAYPAGERSVGRGAFYDGGNHSNWWTSTGFSTSAYYRDLYYEHSQIKRVTTNKSKGYSVRCIKD